MFINLYLFHQSVGEMEGEAWVIEHRFCLVDDAVVRRREDDDVRGVVVHALGKGNDMMGFNHQGVVFITLLLACHLTTIVVE